MNTDVAGQSTESYRRELEAEVGKLHMELKSYRVMLSAEQRYRNEDFERFQTTEAGYRFTIEKSTRLVDSLQKDLDKALSLADLSKQGADTPNPFETLDKLSAELGGINKSIKNQGK